MADLGCGSCTNGYLEVLISQTEIYLSFPATQISSNPPPRHSHETRLHPSYIIQRVVSGVPTAATSMRYTHRDTLFLSPDDWMRTNDEIGHFSEVRVEN